MISESLTIQICSFLAVSYSLTTGGAGDGRESPLGPIPLGSAARPQFLPSFKFQFPQAERPFLLSAWHFRSWAQEFISCTSFPNGKLIINCFRNLQITSHLIASHRNGIQLKHASQYTYMYQGQDKTLEIGIKALVPA